MTLSEKILCHQAVGLTSPEVKPGQVVVVKVARTLASELTWVGMKQCLEKIDNPDIWRNDRFFLAVDHSVDPRNYHEPVIQKRIQACKEFADKVALEDYFGPNESILHTEFYRQRAEPGTVIVGADSHSCAHGCVGALAAGMGAADVVMPLVTGQTWLKVPETVLIELTGTLKRGLVGKDVILWMLKQFGRNTVALDRVVEVAGNLSQLSVDSRFAISNMATEFGAIAGIVQADEITDAFIQKRPKRVGRDEAPVYLRADLDAQYYKRLTLSLNDVRPSVAMWPEPDNVFSLDDPKLYEPLIDPDNGKKVCDTIRYLDGCFIGACTTTESEIILAGLVLEVAMDKFGLSPKQRDNKPYKRQVTPGSSIMIRNLERLGICDIYRKAGFTIGAAGCSYCLGVSVDRAQEKEIWLSSQNRNFRNRMGKGAIGNITSAAVVAASSFNMEITDPMPFLEAIDQQRFDSLLAIQRTEGPLNVVEPQPSLANPQEDSSQMQAAMDLGEVKQLGVIEGRAQVFGDSVDTDAIIPAQYIPLRDAALGDKSFCIDRPEFVERVKQGQNIVVAGKGFGCGSSREEAVSCLRWCGVQTVIAKSFSFIFGRNLLSLDLLGINIDDDEFYTLACENAAITVDVPNRTVTVQGKSFRFDFPEIQEEIYRQGGVVSMYKKYGKLLFKELTNRSTAGGCGTGCAPSW
ncbi:unnamed protein product [Vitrella brassicaformis CCMP3155]|uniref:3-isopropylmalate dehydratase n=1 Tax=Vitrella brassicaformis (strain CCMP3155) TaxID=1169540 RepID=A0A0G4GLS0_VITBC|nr:unnamed protein product [Vitrella brassicaformis CCMP3155]|eukprot:CEM31066.1 unnamed protein product [Vitrella brassicaformis CCMP3155]